MYLCDRVSILLRVLVGVGGLCQIVSPGVYTVKFCIIVLYDVHCNVACTLYMCIRAYELMMARHVWLSVFVVSRASEKLTVAPSFSMLPRIEPSSPPALLLGFFAAEVALAWFCVKGLGGFGDGVILPYSK